MLCNDELGFFSDVVKLYVYNVGEILRRFTDNVFVDVISIFQSYVCPCVRLSILVTSHCCFLY